MAELIAKGPLDGQAPVKGGGAELSVAGGQPIWSIALFPGKAAMHLPEPGKWIKASGGRLVWTGLDQALLIGGTLPEGLDAAVTDQSDGWACLRLTGPGAEAALARLVPVDLRAVAFPPGSAIRAPLNHMSSVILRDAEGIDLLVFRSMARTAWHELAEVLAQLEARAQAV